MAVASIIDNSRHCSPALRVQFQLFFANGVFVSACLNVRCVIFVWCGHCILPFYFIGSIHFQSKFENCSISSSLMYTTVLKHVEKCAQHHFLAITIFGKRAYVSRDVFSFSVGVCCFYVFFSHSSSSASMKCKQLLKVSSMQMSSAI